MQAKLVPAKRPDQTGWWLLVNAVGKARKKSEMMMFRKGTDREVFGGHSGRSK